jgi:hypothetical protein
MGGVVPVSDLGGYGRAWGGWWSEPPYSMHFGPDGGGIQWLGG